MAKAKLFKLPVFQDPELGEVLSHSDSKNKLAEIIDIANLRRKPTLTHGVDLLRAATEAAVNAAANHSALKAEVHAAATMDAAQDYETDREKFVRMSREQTAAALDAIANTVVESSDSTPVEQSDAKVIELRSPAELEPEA